MHSASEHSRELHELFERFSSEINTRQREALEKYIDLLKDLVAQQQEFVRHESSHQEDPFSEFAKTMMASYMRMLAFHRQYRSHWVDVQASLGEIQLRWLDLLKDTLRKTNGGAGE